MTLQNTNTLRKQVAPYEKSTTKESVWQIVNTVGPYIALWYLSYLSLSVSYWLALVPIVLAAGFFIRIFIIFHDCTHHSFFKNRGTNRLVGTAMGVLTLFPFDRWGNEHAIHHATSGNLDKRGTGDIWTLTVDEYLDAPLSLRLAYRIYRNPFVMFGLGPIFELVLKNRLNRKGAKKKERMNTYLTNVLILALNGLLFLLVGWQAFLLVQGSIFFLAGSVGIWLFYVQHTFEDSYFEENKDSLGQAEQVEASHILVEDKATAEKVLKKLKNGGDFAELAKEYSTDEGSAANGGSLGYFGKGEMVAEFEDVAFKLEVGKISEPVKTEYGYHIIKVTNKKEAKEATLKDSKEQIKETLLTEKLQTEYATWLQKKEEEYKITNKLEEEK